MDEKPIKYIENESCTSSLEEQKHIENAPFVKSEAEKRLVRKLNMRLLPLALLIVFLQVKKKYFFFFFIFKNNQHFWKPQISLSIKAH